MDLHQLRCFLATAEELHFGRAARRLDMLPSALGRQVRLLEDDLGVALLARTTRNVALTPEGSALLEDARDLLARADRMAGKFRGRARRQAARLRIGAIDSAAAGLVPLFLGDFRQRHPDVTVELTEDKTIRLLPRLLSGRLDLALVRPPETVDKAIDIRLLFHETAVVALPASHPLARRARLAVTDLSDAPLIVPDRRSRPHSHDLTVKLFAEAGLQPRIAQVAAEKQTILTLVAAEIGLAIVPRWTSRLAAAGVRFVPLKTSRRGAMTRLPLAAAWLRQTRDPIRDAALALLDARLSAYAAKA